MGYDTLPKVSTSPAQTLRKQILKRKWVISIARNDGIDRIVARNNNLTAKQIGNTEKHNERKKESYVNPDIVSERTHLNYHYGDFAVEIEETGRKALKRLNFFVKFSFFSCSTVGTVV